ncbi:hypothetical protein [Nocardia sp. NBC_00416]|uniref:hypothetical protein n=1 Tax=Nocardia sp. NBC_00416 TaxID=2975991 RepID=UPI002E1C664C
MNLDCPSGASEAVRDFIHGAEIAIRNAVDLLAGGAPLPLPTPECPSTTITHQQLGSGAIGPVYQDIANNARGQYDSLLGMDDQVAGTLSVVADQQQSALRKIMEIVDDLKANLAAAQGRILTTAENTALTEVVAHAVELVYEQVANTSDRNTQLAGGSGDSGAAVLGIPAEAFSGLGAGAGSAPILAGLAALPMAAASLASMRSVRGLPEKDGEAGPGTTEETVPAGTGTELGARDPASVVQVAGGVVRSVDSDNGQPGLFPSLPGLIRNSASRRGVDQQVSHTDTSAEEDPVPAEPVFEDV